jgi:hypothetical protein
MPTINETGTSEPTTPAPRRKARKAGKPKAAKKTSPSANGKAKRLSALDAVYTVLKGRSTPMSCSELIEVMAERKLWVSPGGATPAATLSAAIGKEISTKGKNSRFKKASPGHFTAK